MTERSTHESREPSGQPPVPLWPRLVGGHAGLVAFVGVWFLIAGRATWVQGWALIACFLGYSAALAWWLRRANPDLFRERNQPAENVEPWDKLIIRCYTVLLLLLVILAALDSGRFRWSAVPLWAQLLGWVALCVTGWIIWHVMAINAYLSSWARIQEDRGQVVVREGLYRHVRHPMYLGIIISMIGLPLALASWWTFIPSSIVAALFVYRTAREDRMLMQGLPGYPEYAAQVSHRLLPGVW